MRPPHVNPYAACIVAFCLFAAAIVPETAAGQSAPSDSLQHHWALDESSGTVALDSTGTQHGTLALGPVWRPTSGVFGGALEFDGSDDRVALGAADIEAGPGMTLSLWMRADDFDVADARLISKATSALEQDHYWMLSTISSTGLRFRVRAGGTTTTVGTSAGQVQAGEWYHVAATYDGSTMRLYKNGTQVASTAKTGAIATSGSVNASIGNQPFGAGARPFDGLIDDVRVYNRALSAAEILAMNPPQPPPAIVLFHGDTLDWGQLGVPQTWVDIQGRILGMDRVDSLYYAVNGGSISQLNMGPDGFRLVDPGDFNIEIDHTSLSSGPNDVVITVVDTVGQRSDTTVTVNYTGGVAWNLPDTLAFSFATNITDEAYIIDGSWVLVPGGVRTDSTAYGYDRLLVAGESTWETHYEVLVPLTIHDFESSFPDNGPAIGVGFGWTGHDGAGQPRLGHPYQSIAFIRGLHASPYLQLMRNGDVGVATTPATIDVGTRYMMRVRSDSASATTSLVRMRVWEDGTAEPSGWDLESSFTTRDGSMILIAHRADVTFGDAIIQPLEHVQTPLTLIRSATGMGSVTVVPNQPSYLYGDTLILTAQPMSGWMFDSWSAGLSGSANPDTVIIVSDTTVTALFVPLQYVVGTTTVGSGQVSRAPDAPSYTLGDTVIVTATPDPNWAFSSWSGGLAGTENPDTIVVAGDTTVTANFTLLGYAISTNVIGGGGVVRTPDQPYYAAGDTVELTALPNAGWSFQGWSGGLSGTANPDTIIVAGDSTVTATFDTQIVSDDFHYAELDTTVWRLVDPIGDATLVFSGTNAIIDLPGGISHDLWNDCNCAPRLLQSAPDIDFQIEARFDSRGSRTYQSHGLIVQQDDDTFIRFDIIYWSGAPFLYSAFIDGASVITKLNVGLTGNKPCLRVTRSGNTWTFAHSTDGISWTNAGSFSQAITVTEVGLSVINHNPTESTTPAYVASVDYFFNSANPISPEDGGEPNATTPPVVVVSHGDNQYANLGNPQHWHNVVGRVWDVDAVDSLRVSVNGGAARELNMGPDGFRLVGVNDFVAEIPYGDLGSGDNDVVITAIDTLGERTDHVVTLNYTPGVAWAMPDTLDFAAAARVDDEAYVVDGRWLLTPGGVRTDSSDTGYDRLLAFGDTLWPTDYEVVTPVTIHASDLGAPGGVGIVVGWQGHEGSGQPRLDPPYQTIAFIRKVTTTPELQLMSLGDVIEDVALVPVVLGTRYLLKLRSESIGGGQSHASAKLWEDGTSEPAGWQVEADFTTRPGSALLVAHKSDVEFGTTIVTPLPSFPQHGLDIVTVGSGTVQQSPPPDSTLGLYADNTVVTLSAQPDTGWVFGGWSGALTGNAATDSVVMVADTTVTATFLESAVIVTAVNGNGSIVVSPDTTYLVGDTVVVSALPDSGWSFAGWTGALVGAQSPDTLVLASDTTSIIATFTPEQFVFVTSVVGNGQIVEYPDSATYSHGDTVIVSAVPDVGWSFDGWSGGLTGMLNPDTIIVASDTSVTATFTSVQYTIATSVVGSGQVTLSPDQPGYLYGDTVLATAVPDTGWTFVAWTGGLAGVTNPDTIIVAQDTTVTATFAEAPIVLTLATIGSGAIVAVPDQASYALGDTVVVSAVPATGWTFDSWSGALTGSENPDTVVVTVDTTVTATFVPIQYAIGIAVVGNGVVTRTPDQPTYAYGDTVIVTAVPDSAWSFKEWTGDLTGTVNPDTVVVDSALSITASFEATPTAVTMASAPRFVSVQQNFPNPFGLGTTIRYGLPGDDRATLEVFDVRGRLVVRRDLPARGAGWHEYRFEASDKGGRELPAGVYFYRLRANGAAATRKMIIVR